METHQLVSTLALLLLISVGILPQRSAGLSCDLTFANGNVTANFGLSGGAVISECSLQEGFFPFAPVTLVSGSTLDPSVHRISNYPVDYNFLCNVSGVVSTTSCTTSGLSQPSYPSTFTLSETICSSVNGVPFWFDVTIDSLEKLQSIGNKKCTLWTGGLILKNLDLTPAQYYAGLGTIEQLDGYLEIHNVTGLSLRHFGRLRRVAAGNPPLLKIVDGVYYGLDVQNNFNFDSGDVLEQFTEYVLSGRLVVANNTGFCFGANDTLTRWWGDEDRLYIRHSASNCGGVCRMHLVNSNDCVSSCSTCNKTCSGGIISSEGDLQRFIERNCSYINGYFSIFDFPEVSEATLEVFSSVIEIEGVLEIFHNQYLVSLDFFRNLQSVGAVVIKDNRYLVDARLPSLIPGIPVSVDKFNRHLCSTAYPYDSEPCGEMLISAVFEVRNMTDTQFNQNSFTAYLTAALSQFHGLSTNLSIQAEEIATNVLEISLSFIRPVNESYSARIALENLISSGMTSFFVGKSVTLIAGATRIPVPLGGYDTGISIRSAKPKITSLEVTWNAPLTEDNNTINYLIEYAQKPDPALVQSLAAFFKQYQILDDDDNALLRKAEIALEALQDAYQADAGVDLNYQIESCQPMSTGSYQSENCISYDEDYHIKVTGYQGSDSYESDVIVASGVDSSMTVENLETSSQSSKHLMVQWQPPTLSEDFDNVITGYRIQIRYDKVGNAESDYGTNADAYFIRELLSLDNERFEIPETFKNVTGCFNDFYSATVHCIRPWTTYKVTVRTLGTNFNGLGTSAYYTTDIGVPDYAPTMASETTFGADVLGFFLTPPINPTGPVTHFHVYYTSEYGQTGEYNETMTRSLQDQVDNPTAPFEVVIPNLEPYTEYSFQFAARTSAGVGVKSTSYVRKTDEIVPRKMNAPFIYDNVDGVSCTLQWEEPFPLPGNITQYEIFIAVHTYNTTTNSTNQQNQTFTISTPNVFSLVLNYSVSDVSAKVRAVTSKGTGPYSEFAVQTSGSTSTVQAGTLAGGIVGGVFILAIIVAVVLSRLRDKHDESKNMENLYIVPDPDNWEYDRSKVVIGRRLGEGAFGIVCEGVCDGIREFDGLVKVAIKQCSGENITAKDKVEFIAEANLMKKFADPWHKNVIRLLGVCTQVEPMLVLMEFMEKGDLKEVLRLHRPTETTDALLSPSKLAYMAADIASGMSFLASLHFVHRDLACRNCLVDSNYVVKIADFGMSRDVHYQEYYRKNGEALMPVRWMAPECLLEGIFTTNTDVWSMGIVLWEIFTFGQMPYPGLSNQMVYEKVIGGYRMEQPPNCPDAIYALMRQCWGVGVRPEFDAIEEALLNIAIRLEKGVLDADLQSTGFSRANSNMSLGQRSHLSVDQGADKFQAKPNKDYNQSKPSQIRLNELYISEPDLTPNQMYASQDFGDGATDGMKKNITYTPMATECKKNELYSPSTDMKQNQGYVEVDLDADFKGRVNGDYQPFDPKLNSKKSSTQLKSNKSNVSLKATSTLYSAEDSLYVPQAAQGGPKQELYYSPHPSSNQSDYIPLSHQTSSHSEYVPLSHQSSSHSEYVPLSHQQSSHSEYVPVANSMRSDQLYELKPDDQAHGDKKLQPGSQEAYYVVNNGPNKAPSRTSYKPIDYGNEDTPEPHIEVHRPHQEYFMQRKPKA